MTAFLVSPESLPATGKLYIVDDQSVWEDPVREFGMDLRILTPLRAELTLFPQKNGVHAHGVLTGSVAVPCTRCAEDAAVDVAVAVDSFEPYPPEAGKSPGKGLGKTVDKHRGRHAEQDVLAEEEPDPDADSAVMRIDPVTHRVVMDLAALVWQEFSLALPVKPLCDTRCKGLCPQCGANRNTESCGCARDEGDPRLAKLRNLTIK